MSPFDKEGLITKRTRDERFCRILELECRNTYPQIQLGLQGVKLLPSRHISGLLQIIR